MRKYYLPPIQQERLGPKEGGMDCCCRQQEGKSGAGLRGAGYRSSTSLTLRSSSTGCTGFMISSTPSCMPRLWMKSEV